MCFASILFKTFLFLNINKDAYLISNLILEPIKKNFALKASSAESVFASFGNVELIGEGSLVVTVLGPKRHGLKSSFLCDYNASVHCLSIRIMILCLPSLLKMEARQCRDCMHVCCKGPYILVRACLHSSNINNKDFDRLEVD